MAKSTLSFVCQNCGAAYNRWQGKCESCGERNRLGADHKAVGSLLCDCGDALMPIDHEFGDQHTELKLSIVEKYLKFFTTALRGKFKEHWYIDAFAGTGSRTVRHEERAAGLLDAG